MESPHTNPNYQPIEDYGVIGNLRTVALVAMNGSIDFMCFPHFDSPSVFARMLDHDKGGHFSICPVIDNFRQKQLYFPNTNMLLTRFLSDSGVAEVSDYMPIFDGDHHDALIRRVKAVQGDVKFRLECAPRFNYARSKHTVSKRKGGIYFQSKGKDKQGFILRTEVNVKIKDGDAVAEFVLRAGESVTFVFEEACKGENSPSLSYDFGPQTFKDTSNFWGSWIAKSKYRGRWREQVDRSALALKLMTSEPYGAIVASPTFGLPEEIGGTRNWDYRYTWIRDASFTVYALLRLGFTDEAHGFMGWIRDRCDEGNPDGSIQIMYGINGRHKLPEIELKHLEGYMQSSPVRIGNGAANQLQLDIYGELLDSVYLYDQYAMPISQHMWGNLSRSLGWVCKNWKKKDQGIWEVRGGPQEFLYSRLMCWVALDRGIKIATNRSFPAPLEQWRKVRDTIYQEIYSGFWNKRLGAFVQSKGGKTLDASSLIMPLVQFISPTDPQWLSTLQAIEKRLVTDSLVFRYRTESGHDGIAGNEGTFCMCSFWYVEAVARTGDVAKARFLFEKMLGYSNHLGLYSEELSGKGEHLGNMPQAFTHLGLISAAVHLDKLIG